jgi:hypothetical protein
MVGTALKMKLTLVFLSLNFFLLRTLDKNRSLKVDEARHLITMTKIK